MIKVLKILTLAPVAVAAAAVPASAEVLINGAAATFPYPLHYRVFIKYGSTAA